jgi:zinc transporter ZupT
MRFGGHVLFGLLLMLANIGGGMLVASAPDALRRSTRLLKYLVALGAGFMLGAIFLEVLPRSIELWRSSGTLAVASTNTIDHDSTLRVMLLLLAGYLIIHFFEHTLAPHFHFGAETHTEAILRRPMTGYTAIGGLSVHAFFDGVSTAAAFAVDYRLGLFVFVAIMLHKVPEGFTAASIMLATGATARRALAATCVVGGATLLGVLAVILLQTRAEMIVVYALPFSAGVTLYVAASDLIPEVNHHEDKNPLASIFVIGGVALFYLLHIAVER